MAPFVSPGVLDYVSQAVKAASQRSDVSWQAVRNAAASLAALSSSSPPPSPHLLPPFSPPPPPPGHGFHCPQLVWGQGSRSKHVGAGAEGRDCTGQTQRPWGLSGRCKPSSSPTPLTASPPLLHTPCTHMHMHIYAHVWTPLGFHSHRWNFHLVSAMSSQMAKAATSCWLKDSL